MTIFAYPTALKAVRIVWGQQRFDLGFENGDAGSNQSRILAPPRWKVGLVCSETLNQADAALWRATILQLEGRIHQLAIPDLGNPAPRGTMRGTLTLASAAAAGDRVLNVTGGAGQAGTTYLAGDWVGVGSGSTRQLLSVAADAVANGSGVIAIPLSQPLRWAQASGSAVTWDKPTALFRQINPDSSWAHDRAIRSGYSLDMRESWE